MSAKKIKRDCFEAVKLETDRTVGSTISCEGSRTGFYTDDFNDQSYKPPEEIRKASLCGVNLVGARIERIDFYLVDLRCAIYTKAQAQHLSKNGAILPISPIKKMKSHNPVFDAKNADWPARHLASKPKAFQTLDQHKTGKAIIAE